MVTRYLLLGIAWAALAGAAHAVSPGAIAAPGSGGDLAPPLRSTVEAHLAAIAARDMEALLPTITNERELVMIAPNGFKYDTRQQYIDFHREWFTNKDHGQLATEIVSVIEGTTLGHALVKYRYTFKDKTAKTLSYVNWLTLTFSLEYGSWRLVFDQNTPVMAAK